MTTDPRTWGEVAFLLLDGTIMIGNAPTRKPWRLPISLFGLRAVDFMPTQRSLDGRQVWLEVGRA